MKYRVTYIETTRFSGFVEANSEDEVREIVLDAVESGERGNLNEEFLGVSDLNVFSLEE